MSGIRGFDRQAIDYVVQTTEPVLDYESSLGPVKIAPYAPGDEVSLLECFREVFKVERSIESWNWEYRDNPHGIHAWLGKLADGTVVSQFCALPVNVKVGDEDLVFGQVVDSMVLPKCREGLKKRGLFALTLLAHAFSLGHHDREIVQFGLPNPIAYRIGVQTCYYVPMTKVYTHSKRVEPDTSLSPLPERLIAVRNEFRPTFFERFGDEHDALWEKVKKRHGVIAHRDQTYMNWRYGTNPNWDYRQIEMRTPAGELCGVAVTRDRWLGDPDLIIADWMVDSDVAGADAALILACEHVTKQTGHEKTRILLNHMVPESRIFEDKGYDLENTKEHFRMVTHSYDPKFVTEDQLNRYWYYTLGDFDVV
ncbi:MAG: GNAT family N-acetyltransferase [Planctomycetota bacterium]